MLARLLRIVTLAWGLAWASLLALGALRGWSTALLVGVATVLLLHPTVLLVEFLLMAGITRRQGGARIPSRRWVRAWLVEWSLSTRTFGWRMPWHEHMHPDHLPPSARGRRGVVLLHGYVCNRALWNGWMTRLRAAGHPFIAPTLEPVFGGIESNVAQLDEAIARLTTLTGRAPLLVAHSMGGLVVRAWLREHPAHTPPIETIFTIATPHRGTWLARFGLSANARQMRLDSDWLGGLAAPTEIASIPNFTCWWSDCDQVVWPAPTAVLPGGQGRYIEGVAHLALTRRPEIFEALLNHLAD